MIKCLGSLAHMEGSMAFREGWLSPMTSTSSDNSESPDAFDECLRRSPPADFVLLKAPKTIMESPQMLMAADRLKLSDNAVTMMVSAFINACDGDIGDFTLSRRNRIANRHRVSLNILEQVIIILSLIPKKSYESLLFLCLYRSDTTLNLYNKVPNSFYYLFMALI